MKLIRLINKEDNPFWINPDSIDTIIFHYSFDVVQLTYHSGNSCMCQHMEGSVDDVKKMIDEAISGES